MVPDQQHFMRLLNFYTSCCIKICGYFFGSRAFGILFNIVAIIDLSFSFLPVEEKKTTTLVLLIRYATMHYLSGVQYNLFNVFLQERFFKLVPKAAIKRYGTSE